MGYFYKNQQPLGWTASGLTDSQRAYDVHFDSRYAEYDISPGSPKQLAPGNEEPEFYQAFGQYGLCDRWPITTPTSGQLAFAATKFHQLGDVYIFHNGELIHQYFTPKTSYNRELGAVGSDPLIDSFNTNGASGEFDVLIQLNGRTSCEYTFFIGFDD